MTWFENICRVMFCGDVRFGRVRGMSDAEVMYMLKDCVRREVIREEELNNQPKVCVLKDMM